MLKSENSNYTDILQGGGARLSAFGGYFSLLDRLKSLLCRYSKGTVQFSHSEDEIRRISLNEGSFAYAQDDNARHSECGAQRISVPEARHYNASWIIDGSFCKDDENVIVNEVKQSRKRDCGQLSSPAIPLDSQQKWIASSQAPRNDRIRSRNNVRDDRLWHILPNTCHRGRRKPVRDLKKKAAFTLAEVLITLGILGIIAAMTLPMLIESYSKIECEVRLKKFYSTLANAINLAIKDYGEMRYWAYPDTQGNAEQMVKFTNTYIFPYLVGIKKCGQDSADSGCSQYAGKILKQGVANIYIFSDGSCFGMNVGGSNSWTGMIHIYYDYNCLKGPNEYGKDEFDFNIRWIKNNSYTFKAGGNNTNELKTREELLDFCKNAEGEMRSECSALIQYDNWQIKDDYPWW